MNAKQNRAIFCIKLFKLVGCSESPMFSTHANARVEGGVIS